MFSTGIRILMHCLMLSLCSSVCFSLKVLFSLLLSSESLLLGSLSWLVSIVCLFLVPVLPNLSPKDINPLERGLADKVVSAEKVTNKRLETNLRSGLVVFRKRCRGMRTRMKNLFVAPAFYSDYLIVP